MNEIVRRFHPAAKCEKLCASYPSYNIAKLHPNPWEIDERNCYDSLVRFLSRMPLDFLKTTLLAFPFSNVFSCSEAMQENLSYFNVGKCLHFQIVANDKPNVPFRNLRPGFVPANKGTAIGLTKGINK